MAPPSSRRPKQGSSTLPSPNPLPGIAIGIFAVIAAGFAVARTLRRKRRLQSLKDEDSTGNSLLVHERENQKIDLLCPDDTFASAYESPKLLADLQFVVDSVKDGLCLHKSGAEEEEQEKEKEEGEAEVLDGRSRQESLKIEGEENIAETEEKAEISGEDGEISEIAVTIKASLIIDEASMKDLQSIVLENEGGGGGREEEEEDHIGVVEDEDTGEDGDDDRSSADQSPSPVLISGRILDFFEEMSDLRNEPDVSMNGSNSLSDSFSECSMQEVSSAPVKPFVLADEAMQTLWISEKPDFVGASDQFLQQEVLYEEKNWSDVEKTSPVLEHNLSNKERELPEMVENCPGVDKEGFDLKQGLTDSSDELDGEIDAHGGKPVVIMLDNKDFSIKKINEINVEMLSDTCVALKGEFSIKLDEKSIESARINGKVLSDAKSSGVGMQSETASTEQVQQAVNESGFTLGNEAFKVSARINGKVLSDESQNDPSLSVALTSDVEPSLQSAQEGACFTVLESHCETKLQPAQGVSLDTPHADVEVELLVESIRDMPGLESDGEIDLQGTRGEDVDNPDVTYDVPGFESEGQTDLKGTMETSTDNLVVNFKVEPNEESTQKMTPLESYTSEELVHAEEESAVQSGGHICDVVKDDNRNATYDMVGLKESLGVSTDNTVVNPKVEVGVDSIQELPSLERDPLSLHAEGPPVEAGGHDITISESIKDDNTIATCDMAGLGSARETNLQGRVEVSIDNPVVDSEVELIVESTCEQSSLVSGSLEALNGDETGLQSSGYDIIVSEVIKIDNTEDDVDIKEEQLGFPLASLKDSIEHDEHSSGASADKVELSCGGKEREPADLGIAASRVHAKQQEIEEISRANDVDDDFRDRAPLTQSSYTLRDNTREIDQPFTKAGVGLQSRSKFSSKVLKYLPIEIGLICLLIALVSNYLLQYLEVALSIQQ